MMIKLPLITLLKAEHPEKVHTFPFVISAEIANGCPDHFGYADRPKWCYQFDQDICLACWNRKVEVIVRKEVIEE